ncbi:MAG: peptidoglycan-binding domain-containing protein [Gemmatimonadaceae bacterium]|nr:peptidoglycan-binding domain-containing protein [Gemmatimonadaceae bacterium]
MQSCKPNLIPRAALCAMLSLFAVSTVSAQTRVVLPRGTVILVTTQTPIESSSARVGQTFETVVADIVVVENYTVIPANSRIRGAITFVQPANRQQSGVIEVDFDRLTLPDGTSYAIQGKLTSTDPVERRQIESSSNQRVVLVGGRGGIGAAIAGAGSQNSSTSGLLGALGTLLSEGRNVSLPAGTQLAVQFEQSLSLRSRGTVLAPDAATIYTSADMIRAAQRALAQLNYFRGAIDGQLTYATQRALFEYQSDKGLTPTGNLDWRTAQALGLSVATGTSGSTSLSIEEASLLRRNAQSLVGRERQELSITGVGRLDSRRAYTEADVELWFALSAFADNASLYEQIVRSAPSSAASGIAGRSLIAAARRVDAAIQQARISSVVRNAWASMRAQLAGIDASYGG